MSDDQAALAAFGGVARLFPLPNLVLFPGVVQGLHIFEERYRRMVADAVAGDGLVTMVLLRQGWEDDYDDAPAVEPIACLGRVAQHELLPDGRYNLRLRGLGRVRLTEEIRTDKPYRQCRAERIPDVVPDDLSKLGRLRKQLSAAVLPQFEPDSPPRRQLQELFAGDLPLGGLCDMLSYALPLPLELKQELLGQPHVETRAELLIRVLDVSEEPEPPHAPRPERKFPPDFSAN